MSDCCCKPASDFAVHYLWENAPGAVGDEPADKPWFSLHLPSPEIATGACVVICPGGAYAFLSEAHEGVDCAEWLCSMGIAACVLRYRVAPRYHYPAPVLDIQRAIRIVRAKSAEWKIDANRIGVWGFSAGGHLACTSGTHYDSGDPASSDPIERVSCRPDFMILSYAVITMDESYTHMGTRTNLIGENPTDELVKLMSNETQVTADTPPTFLHHTNADDAVPAENSVNFYLELRKAGVPAELHIYKDGAHGLGMAVDDPILSHWPDSLKLWFRAQGIING